MASINADLLSIKNKLADLTNNLEQLTKRNPGVGAHNGPIVIRSFEDGGINKSGGDMGFQSRADKTTNNDRGFRDAVLLTVHSELKSINKRSNEVVVTGLPPKVGLSDMFRDMCFSNLSILINVVKTQRLGKDAGKIKPLMVVVDNHETATKLIELSKTLRSSPDPAIRD